jgi:membrane-associated phospholipid phosphatase
MHWEIRIMLHLWRHEPPGANTWQSSFKPEPFAIMTFALAAIALIDRKPRLALAGTVGSFVAVFAAEDIIKPIVESRQLPARFYQGDPILHLGSLTFPSGHVTAAAAIATFAWLIFHRRSELVAIVFVLPVVVAWAMISLGLHYPRDALGAFIVGPLVVCVTVALTTRILGRDGVRANRRRVRATAARPSVPGPDGSS